MKTSEHINTYATTYKHSIQNSEEFWAEQADQIQWFSKPERILSKDAQDHYRWFEGGKLNTCYLAVDRHVEIGRADQVALIYESPVTGRRTEYSFADVKSEVEKLAGGLSSLGIEKGDTVIIYLPMIPEAVFSMLACARIGAVHSVVFGGFAAHELSMRIDDAKPKLLITTNYGIEINRFIEYKPIVDRAIGESLFPPSNVLVVERENSVSWNRNENDHLYSELVQNASPATCVEVDAWDPLYILYTSGTTGKPKGIVRDNGGHAVALNFSMRSIYGCEPGDVFWAASDVGWVVGHSYIVYAPLIQGCTSILFEGKPIKTPDASTFWRIISENKVKVMFTAPTAIRAIRKEDPEGKWIDQYDLRSLKYQFLAGERCDAATLNWLSDKLNIPVIDHWWQTESGWPMLANMAGIELLDIKPGSAGKPVCGYDIVILNENGETCSNNEEGYVAVKLPLPPGCLPSLFEDNERFVKGYLEHFPGYYYSGDGGYKDNEGYFFITGRVDDIINVAGHRLSTAEMEEVVASHPDVVECAVVGIQDELKGQVPIALPVLREGCDKSAEEVKAELIASVRDQIGAISSLKKVVFVQRLPKTRSGKTLRKLIRMILDDQPYSIPSTIEDASVIDEITTLLKSKSIN